jgi:uroporphyrin-III C-methyltransferase/precorrin-2 dehydrogenase/sirohydrochlorin ferrochelatase
MPDDKTMDRTPLPPIAMMGDVPMRTPLEPGQVALVGTGPGDPELLTLRAIRLMQQADVVLHDNLVSPEIMAIVPPHAERIYVGKRRDNHAMRQEEINRTLVEQARLGRRVVRLKGGDPFVFGRGGEEIETLAADRVPFQVVPGITAALGVTAYAGIPLTHRDCSQACIFVTGHLKDGSCNLDWAALARPRQTVVFYMGFLALQEICKQMIAHGLPADWPAAIVHSGTTADQHTVIGNLGNLAERAALAKLRPPSLIVVGEVVRLREKLAWYHDERTGAAATP